jgi:hypothetical protein
MNITFSNSPNAALSIPIELLFWGFVAVYVIHILEESVLGENFVDKVRKNFMPFYDWTKFFWFNTFLLSLNVVAIIVYDTLQLAVGWFIRLTRNGGPYIIKSVRKQN